MAEIPYSEMVKGGGRVLVVAPDRFADFMDDWRGNPNRDPVKIAAHAPAGASLWVDEMWAERLVGPVIRDPETALEAIARTYGASEMSAEEVKVFREIAGVRTEDPSLTMIAVRVTAFGKQFSMNLTVEKRIKAHAWLDVMRATASGLARHACSLAPWRGAKRTPKETP